MKKREGGREVLWSVVESETTTTHITFQDDAHDSDHVSSVQIDWTGCAHLEEVYIDDVSSWLTHIRMVYDFAAAYFSVGTEEFEPFCIAPLWPEQVDGQIAQVKKLIEIVANKGE